MNFMLTNPEAMEGLPPGKYHTWVVSATWTADGPTVTLEYAGYAYDPDDPCLLPLTVHPQPEGEPMTPLEDIVEAVERDGDPYVIIRDGQPAAVLVRHDDWRELVDAVRGGESSN